MTDADLLGTLLLRRLLRYLASFLDVPLSIQVLDTVSIFQRFLNYH